MRLAPSRADWEQAGLEQGRHALKMTQEKAPGKAGEMAPNKVDRAMQAEAALPGKRPKPEWADGLRQLYDSVVNEPLPDSFADLIAKLDESGT